MGSRLDGHPRDPAFVLRHLPGIAQLQEPLATGARLEREHPHSGPVEQDLHIVRFRKPTGTIAVLIPSHRRLTYQLDLDGVFACSWEVVLNQHAAARSEW